MARVRIWQAESRPWSAYWRDHGRVVGDTLSYVTGRFATTLWVWLTIGVALAVPAALYLLEANLGQAAGQWRENLGFSVYYKPGVPLNEPQTLAKRLQAMDGVERVWLMTPDEALAEFRELSGIGDALGLLEDNPLPASVRATVNATVSTDGVARLAEEAAGANGVADVVVERSWLERLGAVREIVIRLYWSLAAILGLGAVLTSGATVRLAIESRLEEVKVLTLVGAGRAYVRRPFLYLGAVYGLGGAVIAAMAVSGLLLLLEGPLVRLFASYGRDLELAGFDPIFHVMLLAAGAVLGVLGAAAASRQRLDRMGLA
ncbi:MAG: ABC transporter permease [Gammaproteobacteria bacterium]|nr:ABC transporter permease [Gammaproteobacteria bacterium]MXY56853.1 ABC transporter permease [Gammaproteobacteria bacterium]MYF27494.1 ABC transporter permease [Gammaproteobacteria bacterium]MYK46447.1 ABC transporter permease [Gammaproteobacteria bacterium]